MRESVLGSESEHRFHGEVRLFFCLLVRKSLFDKGTHLGFESDSPRRRRKLRFDSGRNWIWIIRLFLRDGANRYVSPNQGDSSLCSSESGDPSEFSKGTDRGSVFSHKG